MTALDKTGLEAATEMLRSLTGTDLNTAERAEATISAYLASTTSSGVTEEQGGLDVLLDEYWDLAHAEGASNRTHDTEDGKAQRVYSTICRLFEASRVAQASQKEAGPVVAAKVKPLDLSALLRDAFLAGRGLKDGDRLSDDDHTAWCAYDPERMNAYIRICAALYASPAPAGEPVGIKALEWGKTSYGTPEVNTIVGVYRLNGAWSGGWSVNIKSEVLRDSDGRTNFATVDAAKAAAQADYEARIRSALVLP